MSDCDLPGIAIRAILRVAIEAGGGHRHVLGRRGGPILELRRGEREGHCRLDVAHDRQRQTRRPHPGGVEVQQVLATNPLDRGERAFGLARVGVIRAIDERRDARPARRTAGLSSSCRRAVTVSARGCSISDSGKVGRRATSSRMASTSGKSSVRQVQDIDSRWRVVVTRRATPRSSSASEMALADRRTVPRSSTRPTSWLTPGRPAGS